MKSSVEIFGSLVIICTVITCGLFPSGDAGKTLKLPGYRVKFGTWPLMEVTKTGFKRGRGGKTNGRGPPPPRGPINNYRLGPPPPGKLVLVNPGDKGNLHQQLQASLKHYAKSKPVNLNLPIIVKAPGPHPPPPPPGYTLGPPQTSLNLNPLQNNGWKSGPPPLQRRPSRLQSALQNTAFSNLFDQGNNLYLSQQYIDGPPFPGPFITNTPDGSQIETYVNEGVMSLAGAGAGIEKQPVVPPVLKLGDHLPDKYRIIFAERQIVGQKSPDNFANSGNSKPGVQEYDLALNLGTKYEQGYGPKPPDHHPLLIQTFQKRGDIKEEVIQDLPDTSLTSSTNIVFSTPNISAPLGGRNSHLFKAALAEKHKVLKARRKEKPLDVQVKLLGRLFTKLQRLKPPKLTVPIDDHEHVPNENDDEEEDAWKKVAKHKVDSPIMAVQIQTFSVPEVNSSDPDIVESMAEFGNHDIEFAETDEIVNLMEGIMKEGSSRINLRDLGSNPQEINENLSDWVRHHLTMTRNINRQAHARGEQVANGQFRQYQTFVTPPGGGGGNGWSPSNPVPVDPKVGSMSMAYTASMRANSFSPPPRF